MTVDQVTTPIETQTPTQVSEPWYSSIADTDLKGYTEKKGWKSPQDAVVSYKNLESRLGNAINLPGEKSTPEELNAFYSKLGRPETPEAYQLPVPEGQDTSFAQSMSKVMYDNGIPAKSAQALAVAWNEYVAQQTEAQGKAEQEQINALKSEWGAKYETNETIARNAVKAFGVTGDQIDQLQKVMGFDGAMKFFANLGSKIGEDKFINGQASGNKSTMSMTKDQANQEYNRLINDKTFYENYRRGDPEAIAIMDNIWKYK